MKKASRTSTSYVATLNPLSEKDMIKLDAIRSKVSAGNKNSEIKYRVIVRGRKPIAKAKIMTPDGLRTRSYDGMGNIVNGRVNAKKLDIYIYERRS